MDTSRQVDMDTWIQVDTVEKGVYMADLLVYLNSQNEIEKGMPLKRHPTRNSDSDSTSPKVLTI